MQKKKAKLQNKINSIEKESDGKTNTRVITFILKSGNENKYEDNKNLIVKENLTVEEQKNQQPSYEVSQNYLQTMCEPL